MTNEIHIHGTDRVDLTKLSVTDLHAILNSLDDTLNRKGTSQAFNDFFMPHYENVQDAFFANVAQSPQESLMKVAMLTRDDLNSNYSVGVSVYEEAQKFMGVSA